MLQGLLYVDNQLYLYIHYVISTLWDNGTAEQFMSCERDVTQIAFCLDQCLSVKNTIPPICIQPLHLPYLFIYQPFSKAGIGNLYYLALQQWGEAKKVFIPGDFLMILRQNAYKHLDSRLFFLKKMHIFIKCGEGKHHLQRRIPFCMKEKGKCPLLSLLQRFCRNI